MDFIFAADWLDPTVDVMVVSGFGERTWPMIKELRFVSRKRILAADTDVLQKMSAILEKYSARILATNEF